MPGHAEAAGQANLPFALPDITEAEVQAVAEVIRSRWLTTGARVKEFETRFVEAVGGTHAVALNSATAALHLSLEALGVGPGDLVYVPTYTFAATAEVVRYVGATPVLVDVDERTLNLDPGALRAAVGLSLREQRGRPAVVMPVHIAGVACDMQSIWQVAREFDLAVVEDAAHAFPAAYRGRPVGWMPEDVRGTACYSFYATKTITTGEGGMMVTRYEDIAERVRLMSLHGLSKAAWNRYAGGDWKYDIVAPGYKYNLTDMAAAMGLAQLGRSTEMRARREEIASLYTAAFHGEARLVCPSVPNDRASAWHLYVLRLAGPHGERRREGLVTALRDLGIGVSVHFIPLHLHSYYRTTFGYEGHDFPVALDQYRRALSLPIWSAMTDQDVERVITAVRAALEAVG